MNRTITIGDDKSPMTIIATINDEAGRLTIEIIKKETGDKAWAEMDIAIGRRFAHTLDFMLNDETEDK